MDTTWLDQSIRYSTDAYLEFFPVAEIGAWQVHRTKNPVHECEIEGRFAGRPQSVHLIEEPVVVTRLACQHILRYDSYYYSVFIPDQVRHNAGNSPPPTPRSLRRRKLSPLYAVSRNEGDHNIDGPVLPKFVPRRRLLGRFHSLGVIFAPLRIDPFL